MLLEIAIPLSIPGLTNQDKSWWSLCIFCFVVFVFPESICEDGDCGQCMLLTISLLHYVMYTHRAWTYKDVFCQLSSTEARENIESRIEVIQAYILATINTSYMTECQ